MRDDYRIIQPENIRGCDLQSWHVVECECWNCGHARVIRHDVLKWGERARKPLSDLKFHCQWCNSEGPHKLTVYALPRNW